MTPAEPMGAKERVCDNPDCALHAHYCRYGAHRFVTRERGEYGGFKDTEHQRHLYVTSGGRLRRYCGTCRAENFFGIDPDEVRK